MQNRIPLLRARIRRAEIELEKARKRHEAKETEVHDIVNRIVSARKATTLLEHEYDLLVHLIERANHRGQTREAIKHEIAASQLINDIDILKRREKELVSLIQKQNTPVKERIKERPFEKIQARLDELGNERREARKDNSKMNRIVGPQHPESKLTRLRLLNTGKNFSEELWKLKQSQISTETNPKKRKRLKKERRRAELDFQVLGDTEEMIKKEIRER